MKNDPKFVRDSNSSLKLLTFPLYNVRELETIYYINKEQGPCMSFYKFQVQWTNPSCLRTTAK